MMPLTARSRSFAGPKALERLLACVVEGTTPPGGGDKNQ